jgi:AcrR family transcriptional regulator
MSDAIGKVREGRIGLYRQIICDAGERVIGRCGLAQASIEEMARDAGVSIGTLYRTFPEGKVGIYTAIQEHHGAKLVELTREMGLKAFEQNNNVVDAFLGGMAALVDYMVSHPNFLRLTLRQSWTLGTDETSTEQMALRKIGMEGTVDGIRLGIASGAFIDGDPELLARALVAIQQAHLTHWLERPRPADQVLADLKEMVLRLLCRPEELARRTTPAGSRRQKRMQ